MKPAKYTFSMFGKLLENNCSIEYVYLFEDGEWKWSPNNGIKTMIKPLTLKDCE